MEKRNPKDVCVSKIPYETESMVQSVLFVENRRGSRDYYLCDYCKKYHIYRINKNNKRFDKKFEKELRLMKLIKKRKKEQPRRKR